MVSPDANDTAHDIRPTARRHGQCTSMRSHMADRDPDRRRRTWRWTSSRLSGKNTLGRPLWICCSHRFASENATSSSMVASCSRMRSCRGADEASEKIDAPLRLHRGVGDPPRCSRRRTDVTAAPRDDTGRVWSVMSFRNLPSSAQHGPVDFSWYAKMQRVRHWGRLSSSNWEARYCGGGVQGARSEHCQRLHQEQRDRHVELLAQTPREAPPSASWLCPST